MLAVCLHSFLCTWHHAGGCPKSFTSRAVLFGFFSRFFWLQYLLGLYKINTAEMVLSLCSSQLKLPGLCMDMAQFFPKGCVPCVQLAAHFICQQNEQSITEEHSWNKVRGSAFSRMLQWNELEKAPAVCERRKKGYYNSHAQYRVEPEF